MPCNYQALDIHALHMATTLCTPDYFTQKSVLLEDPAIKIMTDLSLVAPVTISPACTLDEAMDRMLKLKVKLLFVTDAKERLIGLITYSDIQGERPIQFQQSNGISRAEVCILDIMTSIESIEVLDWSHVQKSRVGDIIMTMKKFHRQHALVLEKPSENSNQIRGIFSTTILCQLLGLSIDTNETAQTFAELEKVLTFNSNT